MCPVMIPVLLNRVIHSYLGEGITEDLVVDTITIPETIDRITDKNCLILEAKTIYDPIPGVKHYTYRIDKQLGDGGPGRQRHIHVFHNGEQVFAIIAVR